MAKVALSFGAWKEGRVAPATVEVPVAVPDVNVSPQQIAVLSGQPDGVTSLAISPDSTTLAALSVAHSEVRLWDLATHKLQGSFKTMYMWSYGLGFTQNGQTLAVAHWKDEDGQPISGYTSLWSVSRSGEATPARLQHEPQRGVSRIAASPDGNTLAVLERWNGEDGKPHESALTLWDIDKQKAKLSIPDALGSALAFSPNGRTLAWSAYRMKNDRRDAVEIQRWDLTAGKKLPSLVNSINKNPINSLAFSPDGQILAGADSPGNILVWDLNSATLQRTLIVENRRRISALAFSPDGKILAAAVGSQRRQELEPGSILLWHVATGQLAGTLKGHASDVYAVAFSPDGRILASGGEDKTVRLWDVSKFPKDPESK